MQEEAREKAKKLLQMPPYKKAWKGEMDASDILAEDTEIAHYDKNDCTFAFVDISPGIKCKVGLKEEWQFCLLNVFTVIHYWFIL